MRILICLMENSCTKVSVISKGSAIFAEEFELNQSEFSIMLPKINGLENYKFTLKINSSQGQAILEEYTNFHEDSDNPWWVISNKYTKWFPISKWGKIEFEIGH